MDRNIGIILMLMAIFVPTKSVWEEPYVKILHPQVEIKSIINNEVNILIDENIQAGENIMEVIDEDAGTITLTSEEYFKTEGKIIVSTKPYDYDKGTKEDQFILLTEKNDVLVVNIKVRNLNDNEMIVKVPLSCTINEAQEPDTETGCLYTIEDEDGMLDKMTITEVVPNDSFGFKWKDGTPSKDTKSATVVSFTKKVLNFNQTQMLVLNWIVKDDDYSVSTQVIVNIKDIPNLPPQWEQIISTLTYVEHTRTEFTVKAIDGDTQVNDTIQYSITNIDKPNLAQNITCHPDDGLIVIDNVDRDLKDMDKVTFTITATEENAPKMSIEQVVTLIIEDINDNDPITTINNFNLKIREEEFSELGTVISIEDKDLGDNARYTVSLRDATLGKDIEKSFKIIPSSGYQTASFSLNIINAANLDFDDENTPNKFEITVIAHDPAQNEHLSQDIITIELENWNDEAPEFIKDSYTIDIKETFGRDGPKEFTDAVLKDLYAVDRDIGDSVKYKLLGTATNKIMEIVEPGVSQPQIVLRTIQQANEKIQLFDFEKSNEMLIQIEAQDNFPGSTTIHKTVAQLVINIFDVNDEQPVITMENESGGIEENQDQGYVIPDLKILAYDEDTDPDLKFSIDWDKTYFTKNGLRDQEVLKNYRGCIEIETKQEATAQSASAILTINDVVPDNTPDYEKFDTIYLAIIVTDHKQTVGEKSSSITLVINVKNINDVPPKFVQSTIDSKKSVEEDRVVGSLITVVSATDEDNLADLVYSIEATDGTPEDWVKIDENSGEILVAGKIQADTPKIYDLKYKVKVSDDDEKHIVTEEIVIKVIDVNNKSPKFDEVIEDQSVVEKSPVGTKVVQVKASDEDRDEGNNDISYELSGEDDFFRIDRDSGLITVSSDKTDRDSGPTEFNVRCTIRDNPTIGEQKQDYQDFKIILKDINDQVPIIDENQSLNVDENINKDEIIGTVLATDKDEPNTDNSKIKFEIMSVEKVDAKNELKLEHLHIKTDSEYSSGIGTVTAKIALEGYHGTHKLIIKTCDFGTDPKQQCKEDNEVSLEIKKYNFEYPEFIFPIENERILLKPGQEVNTFLKKYNDENLEEIKATDQQDDKYVIEFEVLDETGGPSEYFNVVKARPLLNLGDLKLIKKPDETQVYDVKIRATSVENDPKGVTEMEVKISFYDINEPPRFTPNDDISFAFTETELGLHQSQQIPEASYTNIGEAPGEIKIYYLLHQNDLSPYFDLDVTSRALTLIAPLYIVNYTNVPNYFTVEASSSNELVKNPDPMSLLKITITLIDVNDNDPKFELDTYFGGIMTSYELYRQIFKVKATDDDPDDNLTYYMKENSYKADGSGISETNQISVKPDGSVTLDFEVKTSMNGYFYFKIVVNDGEHTDEADAYIYIIAENHIVQIIFENEVSYVEDKEIKIIAILRGALNYTCVFDSVTPATDENGNTDKTKTDVKTHFLEIGTNKPVENEPIIASMKDDKILVQLKRELLMEGLSISRVGGDPDPVIEDAAEKYRAWLIGVSVVMGAVLVIFSVASIIKIRSLSVRLNKLSTVKFTSQESVNHMPSAPTSNQRAVEGSNPIYNINDDVATNFPNHERLSILSNDSDLIGVENNPVFKFNT